MLKSQFGLLAKNKFLPLFLTQFLGALNDNVFKNALVVLITYVLAEKYSYNAHIIVVLAAGIFILPWFLFSGVAGQLADKYEKSKLIRIIKIGEIVIMLLACVGFYLENVELLIFILFLMGTQSSFFGPLKYSILPQHLKKQELISGNALVQTATFIAILIGTIFGTLLVLRQHGVEIVQASVVSLSILGWIASIFIPKAQSNAKNLKVNFNIVTSTWKILAYSYKNKIIFKSIIGISWLWLLGSTYLAQFPTFVKDVIYGNEEIIALFLTTFSVGVGLGALLCNKLLKGVVRTTLVPWAGLGMALFGIDLYLASTTIDIKVYSEILNISSYFEYIVNLRILFDLIFFAVCGGLYVVPLYAFLQTKSHKDYTARVIASNNVINSLFMVISSVIIIYLLKQGLTIPEIFLSASLLTLPLIVFLKLN